MSEDDLLRLGFNGSDLSVVRARVAEGLFRAGICEPVRSMFVQAALEIACNTVVYGSGAGTLTLRVADGELRCEVSDHDLGLSDDLPDQPLSKGTNPGLRLAEALTGRLAMRSGPGGRGTTATLAVRLESVSN